LPVAKINSFDFLCEQHGKHCTQVVLLNTQGVNLWEEKAVRHSYTKRHVVGRRGSALALHPAKREWGRARQLRGVSLQIWRIKSSKSLEL